LVYVISNDRKEWAVDTPPPILRAKRCAFIFTLCVVRKVRDKKIEGSP